MTRYGFVIPTYNEAEYIGRTIESIANQQDEQGRPIPRDQYEIVIADAPAEDDTARVVAATAVKFPGLRCTVVTETARSMVIPRNTGIDYLLDQPTPAQYIVSGDADTIFPPTWLTTVEKETRRGATVVSTAGFFEADFWRRCPALTRRYTEHVGTVFFPQSIVDSHVREEERPLFTEQVFRDFGRPVSDCALVIEAQTYRQLDGFRPGYYDGAGTHEIPAVGWPFMFRAEFADIDIAYVRTPEYETSARRMLHEPEALFSGSCYTGEIENYRSENHDQHAVLDHFADRLDMAPLRRYVVKNYLLQQCITRPERVNQNAAYFGDVAAELAERIAAWRADHTQAVTREIFAFADELTDQFLHPVLELAAERALA
ncbi:glycosyltransferase [Streptomyces sp. NRRL WC-3742]|uniref:glycosyltransferase n=1 Tax=Streptomyces sp. NRRL WC-3742 TaxID=1463934 RepID=UPI0004C826F1|nr:glycosyltransferase family A protein [Streptomyces sp. NRRL WC-3742]